MKVILERVWNEPAACIGFLVSLGLFITNLIGHTEWSAQEVVEVVAPFASSLGIRQLVRPDTAPTYHGLERR